ncbi:uncharacterized protein LOC120352218 [Nilaparvata lugens]|uniref:uncharacterized protein LOC120352218 n=1 Tax=Nilaparvata lugens TaxID=108931 RepID=UPI00193D69D8|nr:uncharacterized protein LOC120352218 [Nilaparvata lugens]
MNLYGFILLYLASPVCCGNTTHFRKADDFYDPVVVKTFTKYHSILLKRWYTRNKPLDIVGRNFKVIVEEVPPYIITSKSENGTLSINGYIGDIWNILQEELKFTSTFYMLNITEGKAALQNGTYDIMLNPTTLSSQDIYDIDHSMPIMSSWYKLFMRLKEGQGSSSSYILAWSRDLWLAFVGTVIVITIFMWGISSFRRFCEIEKCDTSNGLGHKLPLRDERTNQLSFSCCLLFVLGSVTQRGFGLRESPTATSLHVVAVLSLLFGLLMQTSYSAALVSRLAVLKTDQGVEKLSDISARKSHSLCIRVENFAYSALFLIS